MNDSRGLAISAHAIFGHPVVFLHGAHLIGLDLELGLNGQRSCGLPEPKNDQVRSLAPSCSALVGIKEQIGAAYEAKKVLLLVVAAHDLAWPRGLGRSRAQQRQALPYNTQ